MKKVIYILPLVILLLTLISSLVWAWHQNRKSNHDQRTAKIGNLSGRAVATFAGGCFWCSESDFEKTKGVAEVISGYTGGNKDNPAYKEVASGSTGHRESVQVFYDPEVVNYTDLLEVFFRHIDPTDGEGQFGDRGKQYAPAVFYHNEDQRKLAQEFAEKLDEKEKFQKDVAVEFLPAGRFYAAEDYHQDYHKKNPRRYGYYRKGSGRDAFIENNWQDGLKKAQEISLSDEERFVESQTIGNEIVQSKNSDFQKPTDDELKSKLTPLQYKVTQEEGTEPAFNNEYWDNKKEGIYVDIVSGEPLFSSVDKYKSGTGWPSFVKPLDPQNIVEKEDKKLFLTRTEVRSSGADSHLGHVFEDGPEELNGEPSTGLRYCLNSASLRFVPKEDLEKEGLGKYLKLFE